MLSYDCYSEWGTIPAGVPQGTKLGPWLFTIMINDLDVAGVDLWKFVDDTTWSETVRKHEVRSMQDYVDDFTRQSLTEKFVLDEAKCKELRLFFRNTEPMIEPITINDKTIEFVTSAKVLGL